MVQGRCLGRTLPVNIKLEWSNVCNLWRGHRLYFQQQQKFNLSLKITFELANSANPNEMPYYAAFHLGIH